MPTVPSSYHESYVQEKSSSRHFPWIGREAGRPCRCCMATNSPHFSPPTSFSANDGPISGNLVFVTFVDWENLLNWKLCGFGPTCWQNLAILVHPFLSTGFTLQKFLSTKQKLHFVKVLSKVDKTIVTSISPSKGFFLREKAQKPTESPFSNLNHDVLLAWILGSDRNQNLSAIAIAVFINLLYTIV